MDTFAKWLLGGAAIAAVLMAIANFWDIEGGEHGGPREYLITLVILAVVTAILFGVGRAVLRSGRSIDTTALILGILAVISNAMFWLGIPAIFGGAAIGLALSPSRQAATADAPAATRSRSAIANIALGLGALGMIVFVSAAIFG